MLFAGLLELPWWGYALAALALTQISTAAVTLYLHRCQTHRAIDLHPAVSHPLRLWLWLTTGMVTKEWVAVHRKHHAKCETPQDPHSPQIHGIHRVLWLGVVLYVRESARPETLARYGAGTPEDWMERNFYSRVAPYGVFVTLALDLALFGIVPGVAVWLVQMVWIPLWAAGVINGAGHYFGYRNWSTPDASTNIVPWGVLIGGEELHNNHHAYPTSARFSSKRHEFDVGWLYIRILSALDLAAVRRLPPVARRVPPVAVPGLDTLQAILRCRYQVLATYDRMLPPGGAEGLATMREMRGELAALWQRSRDSSEQLVGQLQEWCRRAEASGIAPLVAFSRRLRSYA